MTDFIRRSFRNECVRKRRSLVLPVLFYYCYEREGCTGFGYCLILVGDRGYGCWRSIKFFDIIFKNIIKTGEITYFDEIACGANVTGGIAVASSIFTITAMALDRYLAITRPFGMIYRSFSKTSTIVIMLVLWLMSLILFSPILWIYKLRKDYYPTESGTIIAVCIEDWSQFPVSQYNLGVVWFVFMFATPGE
ncbi:hypothetical protein JTB14_035209 [Gonioctena quinquepunctata]|nr:hypothetical protein JTB14_035209 [Gonioctena quinquepunctata]